jgi:hypothetical protein
MFQWQLLFIQNLFNVFRYCFEIFFISFSFNCYGPSNCRIDKLFHIPYSLNSSPEIYIPALLFIFSLILYSIPILVVAIKNTCYLFFESRDSAVGTVTGYWVDDPGFGVRVPAGWRTFCSPLVQTGFGTHSASIPKGTEVLFPGSRAREANHSPAESAEVKKTWEYTSTLPHGFMA